jgi:hypothetical protein
MSLRKFVYESTLLFLQCTAKICSYLAHMPLCKQAGLPPWSLLHVPPYYMCLLTTCKEAGLLKTSYWSLRTHHTGLLLRNSFWQLCAVRPRNIPKGFGR